MTIFIFRPVLFLIGMLAYLNSVSQEIKFEALTEENVFDKQPILSISQDSKGRLWFAGENNIFNYNSQQVQNLVDTDTIFRELGYITKISINKNDDLFIASSTHLYIYNIRKRKWILEQGLPFKKKMVVYNINNIDSILFITAQDGLYKAVPQNESYTLKKILSRKKVQAIVKVKHDQYAISSESGIELITIKGEVVQFIKNLQIPIAALADRVIPSLFFEKSSLWIATKFNGLYHYDINTDHWTNYNDKNSNILSNNVRKIIRDPKGRLLIGTLKGLSVWKDKDHHFLNYKHNSLAQQSLSQNSIYDIFIDTQRIVWIGTYFGGINAMYPDYFDFHTISTKSPAPYRLNSDIISSIAETDDSYWIGSEEEGINLINKVTKQVIALPNLTRSNLVKDLYVRNNKVYIAQYAGGFSIFDLIHKKSTHFKLDDNQQQLKNNVYSIYVDPEENIFLGTNAGLYYTNGQLKPAAVEGLPAGLVLSLKEDSQQNLYALVRDKLFKKKESTLEFITLGIPQDIPVTGFFIDNANNLWFTSGDKIYQIDSKGKLQLIAQFKNNTLGWPIIVDEVLWITSKNGLVYFNLQTQYKNLLNQYDGLPVKNLQNAKLFLSKNRTLFLITLNGLVSLDPKSISFNKYPPSIILGSIQINDNPLSFDRLEDLNQENYYRLSLNHDENFITLDFSSSNFIKPEKNKYRYKLEGFDKDWVEIDRPSIRYTNIPEGKYILSLYASNNDLIWSKNPLQIELVILPPFWKTWWAYLIYAVIAVSILHLSIKFIVERQLLINAEREHSKKINFFTQISHEIRTPLTLITVPIEEIIKSTDDIPSVQSKAKRLQKNANKLLNIVNELLDFKKFDDGKESLEIKPVLIKPYLEDFFYLFSDLALAKRLNYYIKTIEENNLLYIDTRQFDKALFNLLSNAIKYSNEGGSVFMEVLASPTNVAIRIADNGIGISESNQFQIFEEYYRGPNTKDTLGTGIGLALTKKIVEQHHGEIKCETEYIDNQPFTVFTIKIPTKSYPYQEKDIIQEAEALPFTPIVSKQPSNKEILLLVEDNIELADTISNFFADYYDVIIAYNGEEGLEKALHIIPDIIISDVMMPKVDGLAMSEKIKSNILTSHIPLILLTADTSQTSQISGLQYGANVYLSKPFNTQILLLTVRNLLEIASKKRKEFDIKAPQHLSVIDQDFVSRVEQIIDDNLLNDNFGVDSLARELGMSQPILYKKLKSITNLSVNNFIKQYRFKKAIGLLQSEKNISEVAYAVGFSDRKYFSREFKKHFGKNPSEFIADDNL